MKLTKSRTVFGIASVLLAITACSPQNPEQRLIETANEKYIVPVYQKFSDETVRLSKLVSKHCGQSAESKMSLQNQWRQTMNAWQGAQGINFGPVEDGNYGWRIQFWPDNKNLVAKKIRSLLKHSENLTKQNFEKSSSVVQGLPALEYLLFDPAAEKLANQEQRCQLASLISQHLKSTASTVQKEWIEHQSDFLKPGAENSHYPTAEIVLGRLIDSQRSLLDRMNTRKLLTPLGLKSEKAFANPYFVESWRSQHSQQNLLVNIESLGQFYQLGGLRDYLEAKQLTVLVEELDGNFTRLKKVLTASDRSLFERIKQGDIESIVNIQKQLKSLLDIYTKDIPMALGVQLGFNNNDGD